MISQKNTLKLSQVSALLVFCVTAILFIVFTNVSEAGFNDGDSISHYLISRFSITHPYLFLDHWGKPFFTLFSAPFSQAGFIGIQFFNILCATLAALFTYLSAIKLKIPFPAFAILFLIFTPVYFTVIPTGLTEVFFSLVIIVSFYLFLCGRYIPAALLVSFLPFCRTEGFFMLPIFFAGLVLLKQYRAIPLLGAGTLLYSIIGYLYHYHDILWIIHENPYGTVNIYGHGGLFHFISNNDTIFGPVLGCAFLIGLVFTVYGFFSKNARPDKTSLAANIILYGCFIVFFIAHSVFWWKGLFGSLGLNRVMAGIAPFIVLCSGQGLFYLKWILKIKNEKYFLIFVVILAGLVVLTTKNAMRLPQKIDKNLDYIRQAGVFIQKENTTGQKIYYTNRFLVFSMDADPFENKCMVELNEVNVKDLPSRSFILWETDFGPNECNVAQTLLQNTSKYVFLKKFSPPTEANDDKTRRHFEADVYVKK